MAIQSTSAVTPTTPSTVTMRLNGLRPGPSNTCPCATEDDDMRNSPKNRHRCSCRIVAMSARHCNLPNGTGLLTYFASHLLYDILLPLSQSCICCGTDYRNGAIGKSRTLCLH